MTSLVLAATASAVAAQESLTSTFANNNGGGAGGAVYFTLTAGAVDVTITDVDFNFSSAAGSVGSQRRPRLERHQGDSRHAVGAPSR